MSSRCRPTPPTASGRTATATPGGARTASFPMPGNRFASAGLDGEAALHGGWDLVLKAEL